eukprot:COSAG01_NODE_506_length_16125_cov_5.130912_8_plen_90_part_00
MGHFTPSAAAIVNPVGGAAATPQQGRQRSASEAKPPLPPLSAAELEPEPEPQPAGGGSDLGGGGPRHGGSGQRLRFRCAGRFHLGIGLH